MERSIGAFEAKSQLSLIRRFLDADVASFGAEGRR